MVAHASVDSPRRPAADARRQRSQSSAHRSPFAPLAPCTSPTDGWLHLRIAALAQSAAPLALSSRTRSRLIPTRQRDLTPDLPSGCYSESLARSTPPASWSGGLVVNVHYDRADDLWLSPARAATA